MDAPLQGDAGGHTGTAPTHLRYIFTHIGGGNASRTPAPIL